MTSLGRSLRKCSFVFDCLDFRGSCDVVHVSSSPGEGVPFISESSTASHNASMVHISSILLSSHSCPMVSSPLTEGKFQSFGAAL